MTQRTIPRSSWVTTKAADALKLMHDVADELEMMGDTRGLEITRMLINQWEYRVKALENAVCPECQRFTIRCREEYRCTCPPKKRGAA